jgi:glycosyltransferase involved in cell wall biosynthesis
MRALDIFVLPSHFEGFGLVLAEAMAAGTAAVAYAVSNIPELVKDGVTGLLAPARNPVALADAVVRLCRSPSLRSRLGRTGQEYARAHFSADRMVAEHEKVLESIVA